MKSLLVFDDIKITGGEDDWGGVAQSLEFENKRIRNTKIFNFNNKVGMIKFEKCIFTEKIAFEKFSAEKIHFENCIFEKSLIFRSMETNIILRDCKIKEELKFDWQPCGNICNTVTLVECDIEKIIDIEGFQGKEIKIGNINCSILKCEISDETKKRIEINNSKLGKCILDLNKGTQIDIKNTDIEKKCLVNGAGAIKLKNSEINKIESNEEEFWLFLKKQKYEGALFNSNNKTDLSESEKWKIISETLFVVMKSFREYEKYDEADTAFAMMRKARVKQSLASNEKNIFEKMFIMLKYLFVGIIVGWGVKIKNPIISGICIIIMYGIDYFEKLFEVNNRANVQGVVIDAINMSINRFFNMGNNMYDVHFFKVFEIQESVIGMIFITLIVGMFIRKIVR
ncbi:MAG: hypothetical protein ACRC30_09335 [Clostridium sp.]